VTAFNSKTYWSPALQIKYKTVKAGAMLILLNNINI
jgi:hypothetical protein